MLTFIFPGSILIKSVAVNERHNGILAQLGEHLPYKQRVIGSSPIGPIQQQDLRQACCFYGGIAQLARAHGSYPWCREFESPFRYAKTLELFQGLFCCIGKAGAYFISISDEKNYQMKPARVLGRER